MFYGCYNLIPRLRFFFLRSISAISWLASTSAALQEESLPFSNPNEPLKNSLCAMLDGVLGVATSYSLENFIGDYIIIGRSGLCAKDEIHPNGIKTKQRDKGELLDCIRSYLFSTKDKLKWYCTNKNNRKHLRIPKYVRNFANNKQHRENG